MIVGARPVRCQWTARQLASVLLPLPPFIVATVIICLMADLPFRLICVTANHCGNATGFRTLILRMMSGYRDFL